MLVTLTSSAQSEGVTAESGPSVVVWELSLGGDDDTAPANIWLPSVTKSPDVLTTPVPPLELRLSMFSSSSSSGVSGPTPCSDALRSLSLPAARHAGRSVAAL